MNHGELRERYHWPTSAGSQQVLCSLAVDASMFFAGLAKLVVTLHLAAVNCPPGGINLNTSGFSGDAERHLAKCNETTAVRNRFVGFSHSFVSVAS
jgi:hypothetical protein